MMHKSRLMVRCTANALAAVFVTSAYVPASHDAARSSWSYHSDGVLGTSLDMTFVASNENAANRAERVANAEIERMRKVISTWDSTSEASRLVSAGYLDHPSAELLDVLRLYDEWNVKSGGAYSARIGELADVWRGAERAGTVPSDAELDAVTSRIASPAWKIDALTGRVTALTSHALDLNSLGKGYIIGRALEAVRRAVPGVQGGLINIGGDVSAWGAAPAGNADSWRVAIADPRNPADNAPSIAVLHVRDGAVSTSGNYARGFNIAGRHFSHILDPRTGRTADENISVTVTARDNATANALATTLSVLPADEGLRLVGRTPGAQALIIRKDGSRAQSPGFTGVHDVSASTAVTAIMEIDVTPESFNRHRPYVAAWVTDKDGHHVRTLAFWGNRPKYQRELSRWWSLNGGDMEVVDAVTRATRSAGKYSLEWDGLDQAGKAVPSAAYTYWLEVAYENGAHSYKSATLSCAKAAATATIEKAAAFAGAQVRCTSEK